MFIFILIFARVFMTRGVFSNQFSSPKSKSFLGYYRPQIKSIHVFKRIILVKLVSLWKWKCKIIKLLSSHVLLLSFLLRSNRTTLQAQVYWVFSHTDWPIKTRHSHWLCCNIIFDSQRKILDSFCPPVGWGTASNLSLSAWNSNIPLLIFLAELSF